MFPIGSFIRRCLPYYLVTTLQDALYPVTGYTTKGWIDLTEVNSDYTTIARVS